MPGSANYASLTPEPESIYLAVYNQRETYSINKLIRWMVTASNGLKYTNIYFLQDHDGHGPEFCKHMNRINNETGTNITVVTN